MSKHQVPLDIWARQVEQPLARLLCYESVNYCMLIMGHCDPREQEEWMAELGALLRFLMDISAEIKYFLIGLFHCEYLHEQKDSQRHVDRTPWWAPLQQKLSRGIVGLWAPLPAVQ